MSRYGKMLRTFEFLFVFGVAEKIQAKVSAEKSQRAAEKNKEKVEAKCTGFSAEFFGSQSGKQKFKC